MTFRQIFTEALRRNGHDVRRMIAAAESDGAFSGAADKELVVPGYTDEEMIAELTYILADRNRVADLANYLERKIQEN